jgi:hypothetical protein
VSLAVRTGDPECRVIVTFALGGDPNFVAILPLWLGPMSSAVKLPALKTPASAKSWPLTSGHSSGRTVMAVGAACGTTAVADDIGRDSHADDET